MAGKRTLVAAIAASLLAVAGAGGAATQQTPKRGGTLVMGTLVEPACANAFLERCHGNFPPAELIMNVALRGAFEIGPGFTWRYDLVSRVDYTTRRPYTLTYHIRPEARWSDGVPITARDFVFTHATLLKLPESDREFFAGIDLVRSVTPVDAKTVRVVLRSRSAMWRDLFFRVLPWHALRGENFSTVWLSRVHNPKTGAPIGSGPFLIASWDRGQSISFVRNPRYWGAHRANLDRIVLRFCRACGDIVAEQNEWLRTRQLDLVKWLGLTGQELREFRTLPGVRTQVAPGPTWEHFDIRVDAGGHPALERKAIRQALAYGIDRVAIGRALFGSGYPPSDSAVYLSGAAQYRPNWRSYRARPSEARRLLEQAGCRRGVDRIYVCDGERLSLRFVTIAGRPVREQILRLVQRQLPQIGVEVNPVFAPGAIFSQILESGEFDLALFAWIRNGPGYAAGTADLYGCGGRLNYAGYCQRLVTKDLDQARRILDGGRLARVLNRADAQLAKDVPVIPLVEAPLMAAFDASVRGVSLRTGAWNPFENAENWWLDD